MVYIVTSWMRRIQIHKCVLFKSKWILSCRYNSVCFSNLIALFYKLFLFFIFYLFHAVLLIFLNSVTALYPTILKTFINSILRKLEILPLSPLTLTAANIYLLGWRFLYFHTVGENSAKLESGKIHKLQFI